MKTLTKILLVFCCFGTAALQAQTAALTVQGILKKSDGSAVPDDVYTLRFALYDAEFGGTEVWFEVLNNVETNGGLYSAVLGVNGKALDALFDVPYYLSVKIGNSSQELLPRPRLSAAPYALALLGADNIVPSTGNIQAYGLTASHGISASGNLTVGGSATVTGTIQAGGLTATNGVSGSIVQAGSGGVESAGLISVQTGILASTGSINSGSGPFHGYGFLGDGTTGYGSNSYGVASIWASGQNVVNVTNSDVTINKMLKLPNAFTQTYTGSGNIYQLWTNGLTTQSFPVTNGYSMETNAVIKVGAVHAMSDRRAKKDFVLSNPANDLALLQRLRITDYKYKDVIAKGDVPKKGVIAQEVEQIIPEAVGLSADVIPDIYALAKNTRLDAGGTLHLSMDQAHGLKAGDKVRLIAGDRQAEFTVSAVASSTEFSVGGWLASAPEKVFVYGREVNDFHSVDYDYLFTLNISATQELARRVEFLEKENADFKAQNDELRQLLEGLRADLDALKGTR
ncbi:MAG: tail fiber domain-containing protein [Lewinellaceae bacterium]|nr:tail fiber domain-containing protein [Lewinellaceae bacterium]